MAQGYEVIEQIASLPGAIRNSELDVYDVLILGTGAAGSDAALQANDRGMKYLLLEKEQIANTIENFPEGKWVYAEPDSQPPKGKHWLDGVTKEELTRWSPFQIVSNEKCIGCYECSRNCQVGIDVMNFALKQETIDNSNTSCIGCGICVTVCPMDTLGFGEDVMISPAFKLVQISLPETCSRDLRVN